MTIDELQRIAAESTTPPDEPHLVDLVTTIYGSAQDVNYYWFLWQLTRALRPNLCVELGTGGGISAIAMALGAPDSRVVTIDRDPAACAVSAPNITSVCGDTVAWGRVHPDVRIDLLFVDSGHDESLTQREFETYRPLMVPGGVMLFDDASEPGVKAVLDRIGLPVVTFDSLHGSNGFAAVLIPEVTIFDRVAPFCLTHRAALEWLHSTVLRRDPPVRVCEVGSATGGSAIVLADAIMLAGAGTLLCCDDWSGFNGKAGPSPTPHARATFYRNLRQLVLAPNALPAESWKKAGELPPGGRYIWHLNDQLILIVDESGSPLAADGVLARTLDVCFIDGDHTYAAVKRDIMAFLPKMRPGGIMCGHDFHGESDGVGRAVLECFDRESVLEKPGDLWAVYL